MKFEATPKELAELIIELQKAAVVKSPRVTDDYGRAKSANESACCISALAKPSEVHA